MIRHLITLIWNRKRSLAWIFIEQILVFGVMLLVFTLFAEELSRYYQKGNIEVNNVVKILFTNLDNDNSNTEETNREFRYMVESMKNWHSVELVSINRNGAIPVTQNAWRDSVKYMGKNYNLTIKYCDENFYKIFSPKLVEGEWFKDVDAISDVLPALITKNLLDYWKLTGSAIGQTVEYNGRTYRVIGVVEAFKDRKNSDPLYALFIPTFIDVGHIIIDYKSYPEYVIKYKQGMLGDFSRAFVAEFYKNFPRDQFKPELMEISKLNDQTLFLTMGLQLYLMGIPAAFLLIFAFMGTFGVVWMQSKKRIGELGLRIALGCPPARMQRTIIAENLILTGFAMLPGLIVAANLFAFAQEGWEFPVAVGTAVVLMLCFSAFSAWYPARQAAKVQPVEALRANQ